MTFKKKINLKIYKFRFKWWSWDVDISRFALLLFVILSLLPVLPYKREDGELKVLGIPASVDNFYDLGIKAFSSQVDYENVTFKKGSIGYELIQIGNLPYPNFSGYEKNLISDGASKELAKCIILRDMMFVMGTQQIEVSKILSEYPPSPVPAIWIYRSIQSNVLSYVAQPSTKPWRTVFDLVSNKCEPFKYMGPSSDLIEKFNY